MSDATKTLTPSQHQIRSELESDVVGDLLGPAAGEAGKLTKRSVRVSCNFAESPSNHTVRLVASKAIKLGRGLCEANQSVRSPKANRPAVKSDNACQRSITSSTARK